MTDLSVGEQTTRTSLRADRLRAIRERRGWSQRELARLCGLGVAQINKYENGQTDPSAKHLKEMADYLGVSTDYLLGVTDNPKGQLGDTLTDVEKKMLTALANGDIPTMLEIVTEVSRRQPNN